MAGGAIAVIYWLMHIFFLTCQVIVTCVARRLNRLFKEPLIVRRVRRMAIQAIAALDGLVVKFPFLQRIIVAIQAKVVSLFGNELFVGRLMRVMAGQAVSIAHGLMNGFHPCRKIRMARETKLTQRQAGHRRHGVTCPMAGAAFPVLKRFMKRIDGSLGRGRYRHRYSMS